jgi:hypothetical protein
MSHKVIIVSDEGLTASVSSEVLAGQTVKSFHIERVVPHDESAQKTAAWVEQTLRDLYQAGLIK